MTLWDGHGHSIVLVSVLNTDNNWYAVVIGIAGVVWFVAWIFLAFDTPASHPRISLEEQHYIESTIETELLSKKSTSKVSKVVVMYASNMDIYRTYQLPGKQFSHLHHF